MTHLIDARMFSISSKDSSSSFIGLSYNGGSSTTGSTGRGSNSSRGGSSRRSSGIPSSSSSSQHSSSRFSSSSRRSKRNESNTKCHTDGIVATPNLIDLKTISAEEIEWEGYLYKQRKIVKSWTPRYITLQNRTITVYKSKAHARTKDNARGVWVVKQILSSLPSAGFGGSKLQPDLFGFSFLATNGNLIHFVATSTIEKAMWMHMMHRSLHRATFQSILKEPIRPRLEKSASMDGIAAANNCSPPNSSSSSVGNNVGNTMTVNYRLARRFFEDLRFLLRLSSTESIIEILQKFMRCLSKDCEVLFDLETCEAKENACVFKGIYHGREGFVHFASLYATKYLLATSANESNPEPVHKSDKHDDHHTFASAHSLLNIASGSVTTGKMTAQMTFTPARRISRIVLSFRRQSKPSKSTKIVSVKPMILCEHPPCFHEGFLTKRSLALSFSDFDVVGVLGQGGFGTVVLVKRHVSKDEYFAIKIIEKHSGAESALKERRILSGVRHPFLACLRFAFQTPTKLYLGLDYYKGGNLYHHMHSSCINPQVATSGGRRFTIERARFYAAELALGLSYLHSHGIIYRDLKPDNVMLDKTGHIRLVDFGIAKQLALDQQNGSNHYAPTGTLAGSPAYIAPEQLLTQKPQYGFEADWWSYGVLLYEMLCGTTPFADQNISQMYKKIQTADIRYDRKPLDTEEIAVDLLKKLLVRDPNERIGFEEIKNHKFFESINWEKLLEKEVPAPFIPSVNELMSNVHEHFKNMNIEETIGDDKMKNKNGLNGKYKSSAVTGSAGAMGNGGTARVVGETNDEFSHFDEFSFSYDQSRESIQSVQGLVRMADDGWLVGQLREGAALRDRLQSAGASDDHYCLNDPLTENPNEHEGTSGSDEVSGEEDTKIGGSISEKEEEADDGDETTVSIESDVVTLSAGRIV
jgi:serum/glucocorticoid-regulated kinase 2